MLAAGQIGFGHEGREKLPMVRDGGISSDSAAFHGFEPSTHDRAVAVNQSSPTAAAPDRPL
jgi:hypothetical protein